MPRNKQQKFVRNTENPKVIQPGKERYQTIKGKRHDFFGNDNPIVLELACGRGEYTMGLSQIFSNKNFIGVDKKGDRFWKNAKYVQEENIGNVAFLRTIIHHIDQFFSDNEVDEIWLVHPDPRSKGADERRRLTFPRFLHMYSSILKSGGLLRLKTDDTDLFDYSLETLHIAGWELVDSTYDLYQSSLLSDHYEIETRYEKMFVQEGRTIKYGVRKNGK